jgi:acetyl/propionyl-CoA carboxylase alpha subunit
MIRRLLVANRGEIAIRIIHACRELGIESVAVYSEADSNAWHRALADSAVSIGPAPAVESYLATSRIIDAARAAGADAVHPGYGFLSESAAFAAACEAAGVIYVGPPSSVIARMGSKIESRRVMDEAGVAVVPGETPDDQSDGGVRRAVGRVGLPALIKASAGGGGRGMRRVSDPDEIEAAVQGARREAIASFGDGTLYVERFIDRARHVEVQIFGDALGHVVHLFERDCSAQRRHQKVIEESPSPSLTPRMRSRLTEAAVRAARAAEYRNAGTVEFLVDAEGGTPDDRPFYFLEVNTRLQVEHPVTEQLTGVDLVHAQILTAAGAPLAWIGQELAARGHVIEARVYAEDPSAEFLPQAGRILLCRPPHLPGVRVDSGIREGDTVSVHYDPLLAKVIATAPDRPQAVARLASALREFPILGVRTNVSYLLRVLADPTFQQGGMHTTYLETASAAEPTQGDAPPFVLAAMAAADADTSAGGASATARSDPWTTLHGWRTP